MCRQIVAYAVVFLYTSMLCMYEYGHRRVRHCSSLFFLIILLNDWTENLREYNPSKLLCKFQLIQSSHFEKLKAHTIFSLLVVSPKIMHGLGRRHVKKVCLHCKIVTKSPLCIVSKDSLINLPFILALNSC